MAPCLSPLPQELTENLIFFFLFPYQLRQFMWVDTDIKERTEKKPLCLNKTWPSRSRKETVFNMQRKGEHDEKSA